MNLRELSDDLDCCPTAGSPPVRVVPEELCRRISAALQAAQEEREEWVRIDSLQ